MDTAKNLSNMTPSNEPTRVVEIEKLSLVFETADGPVHALSEVDLTIESGEFVSFIRPSRCGKTTLLRAIADLEQPTGARPPRHRPPPGVGQPGPPLPLP